MRVSRVTIGRDVRVIDEVRQDICLEGAVRLCPGQRLTILDDTRRDRARMRQAVVLTWTVTRLGEEGLVYRGVCRADG